ncbi:MAG TPA: SLBB domain-containing protein [Chitinispirillaceae bacterium]|jgi:protein involved in polysaccharide export with SLBB domain|nr:SLBB domain-containing protein [Chitinispirillaceae bacterium]
MYSLFRSKLFLFVGCFILSLSGISAQQVDPVLMSQIQQQINSQKIPSGGQSRILKDLYGPGALSSQSIKIPGLISKSDTTDSISLDSSLLNKPQSENYSVYEKLLRAEDINPDSIIFSLKMFGYDIFEKSKPSTFAPTDFASVPADYPINVSDEIIVNLWGRINEEYRLKVERDGKIVIPRIGPVPVVGLSFGAMKKNIQDKVGKIEGVSVSVSMGELRTIGVYIVGEVMSPGFYTISALSNVTNALFAAGGPTKNGSLRNIQLKRNGKLISNIDFYDFLLSGNDKTGLRLQSGDVILVPIVKNMAAVAGNVRRSALYELNGETTLAQLVELAGGITPAAWSNKLQVERFTGNQYKTVLDIDSVGEKLPDFPIQDGDLVKIFPILLKDKNTVYLSGNVLRPGKYEFKEGMRISGLIKDYSSLLPETYFEYAVVLRQEEPSFLNKIIAFNLLNVLENPGSSDDLQLMERDHIVIYHKDFFEPDRSVYIDGAITNPGKYKLLSNMNVRDLILQAGGLKDEASPLKGEIYRRNLNWGEQIDIQKFDFCVECAMKDDPQHNIVLQRTDRVYIRNKTGWTPERKVTLRGQIAYPGTYVLFDGETLGDLIKRAGGFKEDAYLSAAVFTRKSVREMEIRRMEEYGRQMEMDILKQSATLAADNSTEAWDVLNRQMMLKRMLDSTSAMGRVVVDLENEHSYSNFVLEDGDDLFVPRNLNTVSVIGEVFNPATFKYEHKNIKASHYIEIAGGMNENADKKNIYIIKANGSVITNKISNVKHYRLQPGDAVVVPYKIKYSNPHKRFVDTADAVFKISTIFATLATLLLTISKFKD